MAVTAEQVGFAHAQSVVKLKRTSFKTKTGKETIGERIFISSLSLEEIGDGKKLARVLRAHWEIEINNHWKRDANWLEDSTRLRTAPLARVLALLRGALLGCIKGSGPETFEINTKNHRKALAILNKKSN